MRICHLAWNQHTLHQQHNSQKENYLPHAFLKCMGAELRLIITGFKLKLSSVLLLTALSNHFLLLLPLLPCSASSPLSYSNFHSIFYFAIFSNFSSFLPSLSSLLLLASSLFCICSCSLQHGSLILSLSPQCPPFPLGAPTIHFHPVVTFPGPADTSLWNNMQVLLPCENQVHDHPSRKEKLFTLLLAAEPGSTERGATFQDHQQPSHSDTLTLSLQHQKKQTLAFTHTPCRFWGED